jgi:hypothetical protein
MRDSEEPTVGKSTPPRKADVLFGSGTDWEANACVNGVSGPMAYQDGYRRAALHLMEYVCDSGQGQDVLVYPIVYLYRHHVELTLKSIINVDCFLVDYVLTEKEQDTLGRHDLAKLWGLARPLLNPVCKVGGSPALPPEDLEGIDSYILQLHKHDPDGQRFRYAMTKMNGRTAERFPSLRPELRHINIRDFGTALEKLADYFEWLDMWFGDLVDAKIQFQIRFTKDGHEERGLQKAAPVKPNAVSISRTA